MKLDMNYTNDEVKTKTENICIPGSGTIHTILKHKRYFSDLKSIKTVINTVSGPIDLIEGINKGLSLIHI